MVVGIFKILRIMQGGHITNICLDSGFESQRTFNRVFKERYKISPSDYRSTCVKEMLS